MDYWSQRVATLRAADSQTTQLFYRMPGLVRDGIQDDLVNWGGQADALSRSSNPLLQVAGWTGHAGAGLLYSGLDVVLPFDNYGQAAVGVVGGEVVGAVARIPAVNAALNTDLSPYVARATQAALDWAAPVLQPVASFLADETGALTLAKPVIALTDEQAATSSEIAAENPAPSIEAQFQANSLQVATDAHDAFAQGVANGTIPLNPNPKLSYNLQAGNFVDQQVRAANQVLADQLGLDTNTVQINQRLYAPDGSYTVPDLYFPQSRNIIDYSYQFKTINTPQIQGFISASPGGTITIVPPAQIRPVYTIGP